MRHKLDNVDQVDPHIMTQEKQDKDPHTMT